ncbi:angiopoietin-related protein 5 isoform X2 [Microcaecilia unicolor]|uniref:Angiopoietin-related protein 5-like isoform X2 n=1 Tax=Microcaecilia unicolor TaxID=1415580 RepID=A0A6P7WWL6_9AMPH|nr:angiopoietin-related protein 5-like isoform X2 [Microcaecilia unicolor]
MNPAISLKCFSGIAILLCLSFHQVRPQKVPLPEGEDCSDIRKKNPSSASGVYWIKPAGATQSFQVACEMNEDGGWTVIQRHNGENSLDFEKTWAGYKTGFGNPSGEVWQGLDNFYFLTNQPNKKAQLVVSLQAFSGETAIAQYDSFKVGNEASAYQLSLGAYSGTAGDAFRGLNDGDQDHKSQEGSKFSTKDKDNDNCDPCFMGDIAFPSCSTSSGWWFSSCGMANLNGQWHPQTNYIGWASGLHWKTWKNLESLKSSVLKIKTA